MNDDEMVLPVTVPGALEKQQARVIETFREAGLAAKIAGVFVVRASGPLPQADFWIDLLHHAENFPFHHFIDELEGAVGKALVLAFNKVRKWASMRLGLHLLLPKSVRRVHYIIPQPPDDAAAVRAIKKHYRSLGDKFANEYFWEDGAWISAEEHFARKKARK